MKLEDRVAIATREWVANVVIGYNFCPFARPVFEPDRIKYAVEHSDNVADVLETLYQGCLELRENDNIATTLVIFDNCAQNFDDYLDVLAMAERLMEQSGFSGEFQLASFHPDYQFDGEDESSPGNFTNRSPYPTLHIIREHDIEQAMRGKEDSSAIYERNMRKAESFGCEHFASLLDDLRKR